MKIYLCCRQLSPESAKGPNTCVVCFTHCLHTLYCLYIAYTLFTHCLHTLFTHLVYTHCLRIVYTHCLHTLFTQCFIIFDVNFSLINEAIRVNENRIKVVEIQTSFISPIQDINLVEPHRMFVREGSLLKVCRYVRTYT